ncbi:unnamed protein product, partial [Iphiclides podalirius]
MGVPVQIFPNHLNNPTPELFKNVLTSSIILEVYIDNLLPSTYQLTALPTTETSAVLDAHMDNPQYDIYLYSPTSGCRNTYRYGCPWFTFQLPVAGTKKVTT